LSYRHLSQQLGVAKSPSAQNPSAELWLDRPNPGIGSPAKRGVSIFMDSIITWGLKKMKPTESALAQD